MILLTDLAADRERAESEVEAVAEKLRNAMRLPFAVDGRELHVTPSIGAVMFPGDGVTAEDILRQADTAMYRAKSDGRNTIRFYHQTMSTAATSRLAIESALHHALEQKQFELYYQPQVDRMQRVAGAEALLRWHAGDKGLVSPARFIPVLEESGLILEVGRWVLWMACQQVRAWEAEGLCGEETSLSVNVSPVQFRQTDFVDHVAEIIEDSGIEPARISLELTEGVMVQQPEDVIVKMQALKQLGVKIAIDDFGTGYSSLMYLKRMPVDVLKIDRSFIREVCHDGDDAAIVQTVIDMGRHLGLRRVAEGVENEAQMRFLQDRGCDYYQGFLFGKPHPAAQFTEFLRSCQQGDELEVARNALTGQY